MITSQSISTPNELLATARMFARNKAPYLATALYSFIPYSVDGLGTIGVTAGMILIYDPVWIMEMSYEEVGFLLLHEVSHVLRDHAGRCGHRDPALFNVAGDIGINHDLVKADWKMPSGANEGLLPEKFGFPAGLSAEEYYHLLQQRKADQEGSPKKGKGKGKDQPDPMAGPHGPGNGKCGGIAGSPINKELEDKVDQEVGRSEASKKALEKQVQQDIREHLKSSQGRGSVPADLVAWANLPPKKSRIPWGRQLANILRRCSGRIQAGGMDYSLSHPSKRSYLRGIIRPGLVQQEPEVAFVLDTSGSMGMGQIKAGLREAYAVMNSLGIEQVWWLEADAAVANVPVRIGARRLVHMQIHGGGGTDFGPGIAACEKLRPGVDLILYFTDGDGSAPKEPPKGVEVIWVVVPSYYNKRPAPWGHAVIMRAEGDDKEYPNLAADEEYEEDP